MAINWALRRRWNRLQKVLCNISFYHGSPLFNIGWMDCCPLLIVPFRKKVLWNDRNIRPAVMMIFITFRVMCHTVSTIMNKSHSLVRRGHFCKDSPRDRVWWLWNVPCNWMYNIRYFCLCCEETICDWGWKKMTSNIYFQSTKLHERLLSLTLQLKWAFFVACWMLCKGIIL